VLKIDNVHERLEALRLELHSLMRGGYCPEQMQKLLPLTQEIDRLSVALSMQSLPAPAAQRATA
jgi:hypothetical protein